jgi:recombination protein RecA
MKKDKKETTKLDKIFAQLDRQFGGGSIYRYGDGIGVSVKGVIPTGSIRINLATGIDGVPRGRIIEIFGPESGGKTTLALHIMAEAQKLGDLVAFIDAEHALDPSYAGSIGVEMANVLLSQPDNGEQALEICEALVRSGEVGLIVIDSVAALVPRAEIEGEMGDANMGLHARLMSQAMRKLNGIISKTNCCVIFINQVREKIGVMFGNPETTTGGRALKFYASVRFDIRRIGGIKDGDEIIANKTRVKVVKNKVAPPFKEAVFQIRYGEGIDQITELIELAIEEKVITKSGNWFYYRKYQLGQGMENVRKLMVNEPKYFRAVRKRMLGE